MTRQAIDNIRTWAPTIITLISVVFAIGMAYSELKQMRKEIDNNKTEQSIHSKDDELFQKKLLFDLGTVKGGIESMEKTINGGKVIEQGNGRRIIIWKDNENKE